MVDELPPPRHLVGGQRLEAVGAGGSRRRAAAPGRGTTTATRSSPSTSWGDADHRHLGHARMGGDHVLHVDGVDVVPAPDDHVLGPPADVEVAVLVEPADVAGPQPAVDPGRRRWPPGRRGTRGGGRGCAARCWPYSPAGTSRPSSSTQRTSAGGTGLPTEPGTAHRLALGHQAVDGAGLGHPVVVGDQGVGHPGLQPVDGRRRQRRAAHRADAATEARSACSKRGCTSSSWTMAGTRKTARGRSDSHEVEPHRRRRTAAGSTQIMPIFIGAEDEAHPGEGGLAGWRAATRSPDHTGAPLGTVEALACRMATAFGFPVVPEVNRMSARSSGATATW